MAFSMCADQKAEYPRSLNSLGVGFEYILAFFLSFISFNLLGQEINCKYLISTTTEYVNGINFNPGDTICIEAGHRSSLYIANISGSLENPLVIINLNGIVEIDSDDGYGISITNCQYLIITGSGSSDKYGIQITNVPNGSGMKIDHLSSDIEVTRLEIANTKYAGIMAKSDPTCTFNSIRENFTMYNVNIHNNYLHNIGTEGLYIGNSFYLGVTLSDCDTVVLPHLLDGVDIHHNIIENTGWDGIQLGCALYNSKIHHNQIYFDSQSEQTYQMSGIMLNPGTNADVYNNIIVDGKGTGIALQTTGGQKVYNNLIINAGREYDIENQITAQKFGIFCKYVANVGNDSSYKFINNTIINPKSEGIRFQNRNSSSNLFLNNIIINPGAFDYYENNGNTSNTGTDSYINIYYDNIDYLFSNNLTKRSSSSLYFVDTTSYNYQILSTSPAYDAGQNVSYLGIIDDLNDNPRPIGNEYDIGAYESDAILFVHSNEYDDNLIYLFPNPSTQNISIQSNTKENINYINIYNSTGTLVNQYLVHSNSYSLNIQNLPTGNYIMHLNMEKNITIRKKFFKL